MLCRSQKLSVVSFAAADGSSRGHLQQLSAAAALGSTAAVSGSSVAILSKDGQQLCVLASAGKPQLHAYTPLIICVSGQYIMLEMHVSSCSDEMICTQNEQQSTYCTSVCDVVFSFAPAGSADLTCEGLSSLAPLLGSSQLRLAAAAPGSFTLASSAGVCSVWQL